MRKIYMERVSIFPHKIVPSKGIFESDLYQAQLGKMKWGITWLLVIVSFRRGSKLATHSVKYNKVYRYFRVQFVSSSARKDGVKHNVASCNRSEEPGSYSLTRQRYNDMRHSSSLRMKISMSVSMLISSCQIVGRYGFRRSDVRHWVVDSLQEAK